MRVRIATGGSGFKAPPQVLGNYKCGGETGWLHGGHGSPILSLKPKRWTHVKKSSWVQGATGTKRYGWTTQRHVNLGAHQVTHSFLVIPECPAPLLGRDLLSKVNAQIHFDHGQVSVLDGTGHPPQVLSLALKDEYRLYLPEAPATISPKVQP